MTAGWLLQSDREKEQGLPVAPFMDREKVTKPTAQIGFIKFVLTPMFESVAKVSCDVILEGSVCSDNYFVIIFCLVYCFLLLCFLLSLEVDTQISLFSGTLQLHCNSSAIVIRCRLTSVYL